jgi:hypothetical protein
MKKTLVPEFAVIADRLHEWDHDHKTCAGLLDEAADEIARLRAVIKEAMASQEQKQ